ncbi:MAG: TadE/TadG family type IV pilus assembly protein [Pirellulaceae bacterium]|nr:pilus assembly protein [Planctomycetales bacterium]
MSMLKCKAWQSSESGDVGRFGDSSRSLTAGLFRLNQSQRWHRLKRRGASAVEFAIVAPVFVLLVFGIIEYGRMVMVQQIITNASREGARRAILDGATVAEVETLVSNYLTNTSVSGASVDVLVNGAGAELNTAENGDPITVTVEIDFSQVSWLPSPMFLGATRMTASSVMRRETAN